jgi:pimeloyl-ACP methyl ester carboxylesterase
MGPSPSGMIGTLAAAGILTLASALLLAWPTAAETTVADLPLEDIGSQRALYAGPEKPRAVLVMLPGGDGIVQIGDDGSIRRLGDGFLLRTLPLWQARGFATVVLSPPNGMSLLGQRHTPSYAARIGEVVNFVRQRTQAPVWLLGASQGATAAVGAAARLGDKIAGIVLFSSVTGRSGSGETLFDSEPGLVAVPVLIVANSGDACPASPPGDAPRIAAALANAPRKEILTMQSGAVDGQPCTAKSPHSYFGIEAATIEHVANRIGSAGDGR